MRYATVVITPDDGSGLHPIDNALARSDDVHRDAIREINLLTDGTCVVLYTLRGNLTEGHRLIEAEPTTISCDVSGDDEGLAYIHFEPNDTVHALLRIVDETEIVRETPIECLDGGGVRVTLVGESDPIRRAVDQMPDGVVVSLEGLGDYHPETGALFSTLTDRQQEVLEAAVERGYYEVPRSATHEDVAETVGLSAGTVGEHLRKVEEKVLSSVVPQ